MTAGTGRYRRVDIEHIVKILALLSVLCYVVGLFVVNSYLHGLGISDFELLRARFVYAGLLVIGTLGTVILCVAAGVRMAWDSFRSAPRATSSSDQASTREPPDAPSGYGDGLAFLTGLILIALPWFLFCFFFASGGEVRLTEEVAKQVTKLYALSLVSGVLGGGMAALAIWVPAKRSRTEPDWPVFVLGQVFFLGYLLWYVSFFAREIYPTVPEQFGGGEPRPAQLLFAADGVDGARALGVPLPSIPPTQEGTPESGVLSDPVSVLWEGPDGYVLRVGEAGGERILEIDRELVNGAIVSGVAMPAASD